MNKALDILPLIPASEDSALSELPVAVYGCDAEGKITFYNKAAAQLWGREPVIGKDMWCGSWRIYHADGTAMRLEDCPMATTIREGRAVEGHEIVIEKPTGERRHIMPHPRVILSEDGSIQGAVNMLTDITDTREKEARAQEFERRYHELSQTMEKKVEERTETLRRHNEELKKSEDRYHKMIEEVRDYAILLLDKDGTILNWNKGAEKIKGYTEKEIVGKNFRIFYLPHDKENQVPEQLIEEAVRTGKATNEGLRMRKDGTTFWGSIVITALHDEDGNVIGFSKVTRDLTEKKMADDKLLQYARDLESQNRELARFNYIASHDLQEPLRKIRTFISLCSQMLDDRQAVEKYFEKIETSALRMTTLIKNLLDYSRITEGDKIFEPTDLQDLLITLEHDCELQLSEKNATLRYSGLPVVRGVTFQLYQLFSNLLSNSLKFSEAAPVIDISASTLHQKDKQRYTQLSEDAPYAHIIFRDNGIGFDPEFAEQIFGLFHRLNDTKQYPGSGVGLAICKKIVESHHGLIYATSEPGRGTEFHILLPMV